MAVNQLFIESLCMVFFVDCSKSVIRREFIALCSLLMAVNQLFVESLCMVFFVDCSKSVIRREFMHGVLC